MIAKNPELIRMRALKPHMFIYTLLRNQNQKVFYDLNYLHREDFRIAQQSGRINTHWDET